MKLLIVSLITLTFLSCSPFNKLKTKEKFSKWTVVEKYEAPDSGCIYYWNRGANMFVGDCNLYSVGDTIRHQQKTMGGRIILR